MMKRQEAIDAVMLGAEIICCTLSSSGSDRLKDVKNYIEAIIVDEATQCIELETLIPLQHSPKRVILIGDPKQLPATTFSRNSDHTLFNRSLMQRILDNGVTPHFLDIQDRMQPEIREFPSENFYDGRLKDHASILERPWPGYFRGLEKRNVVFFDIRFSTEHMKRSSFQNNEEAM